MKIYIEETELELFNGARVKDALRQYSSDTYREVTGGKTIITDKNKNPVDLDGELTARQRLYLIPADKE